MKQEYPLYKKFIGKTKPFIVKFTGPKHGTVVKNYGNPTRKEGEYSTNWYHHDDKSNWEDTDWYDGKDANLKIYKVSKHEI